MRYVIYSLFIIDMVFPPFSASMAHAQSTPRDAILESLSIDANGELERPPQEVPEPVEAPETITEIEVIKAVPEQKQVLANEIETIVIETESGVTPIQLEPITPPQIVTPPKPVQAKAKVRAAAREITAPFYTSASAYLKERGEPGPVMTLTYDVTTIPLENPDGEAGRSVTINVGQDFAAITTGSSTRIYDFKFDRLLSVSSRAGEQNGSLYFENLSLYAKAYRNLVTAKNASDNGKRDQILLSAKTSLDVFWIDSAMGFAVRDVGDALSVEKTDDVITADYKGEPIAKIEKSDTDYLSEAHKNAYFAFAHYDIALHPLILLSVFDYDAPPKSLQFTLYNPSAPKGVRQLWTLTERQDGKSGFPLPKDAKSVVQRKPLSPLAFVINEAAKGRALGGPPSKRELSKSYETARNSGQYLQAWMLGQRYQNYFKDCYQSNRRAICGADAEVRAAVKTQSFDRNTPDNQTLLLALDIQDGLDSAGTRPAALKAYMAAKRPDAFPAFTDRNAALTRAKMKKTAAQAAGLGEMDAENLLQTALAKDPYDPQTYLGLAQVLAAKGAFERSWDVYDAMRAGLTGGDALAVKINRFEKNLEKTAPAFFPPDG